MGNKFRPLYLWGGNFHHCHESSKRNYTCRFNIHILCPVLRHRRRGENSPCPVRYRRSSKQQHEKYMPLPIQTHAHAHMTQETCPQGTEQILQLCKVETRYISRRRSPVPAQFTNVHTWDKVTARIFLLLCLSPNFRTFRITYGRWRILVTVWAYTRTPACCIPPWCDRQWIFFISRCANEVPKQNFLGVEKQNDFIYRKLMARA